MSAWERVEPLVGSPGDCGGDVQVSEAFDARWRRSLADGTTALVTRQYYVVADQDGWEGVGPPHVECQTEYLICTDASEPGGTEVWSDTRYHEVEPDTDEPTEDDAWMAALGAEEPTLDEWHAVAGADEDVDGA